MGAWDELDLHHQLRQQGGSVTDSLTPTPDAKPDPVQHQWADPTDLRGQFGEIGTMLKNVPSSAGKTAKSIGHAVAHPFETAENIGNLGKGILQETGILSGTDAEQYPEAVGHYLSQRYGSGDAIKTAMQNDPVGFLLDISTVFSGAGALARGGEALATMSNAAKTADVLGNVGEMASQAGKITSPLNAAGAATKAVTKPVSTAGSEIIGDIGTGTGGRSVRLAYGAGKEGGPAGEAFRTQMRRTAPMTDVVDDARNAVSLMRKERGAAYVKEMKKIGADKTVLKFDDIDNAVKETYRMATYRPKGSQVAVPREHLIKVAEAVEDQVEDWKALPQEFKTAEGFDQLKQRLGDIRATTKPGTAERKMADIAYNAARQTVVRQSPEYARVMKGYEEASDLIQQMEHTLSISPSAQIDTTLRKLQSVLRDNVNTSYGHRHELAEFLVNAKAPHLMEKIAGQALSTWTPRGFGRATAGLEAGAAAMFGGFPALGHIAPVLAASSPRLVGEAAYGLGAAGRKAGWIPFNAMGQGAYQAGRLDEVETDSLADQVRH